MAPQTIDTQPISVINVDNKNNGQEIDEVLEREINKVSGEEDEKKKKEQQNGSAKNDAGTYYCGNANDGSCCDGFLEMFVWMHWFGNFNICSSGGTDGADIDGENGDCCGGCSDESGDCCQGCDCDCGGCDCGTGDADCGGGGADCDCGDCM